MNKLEVNLINGNGKIKINDQEINWAKEIKIIAKAQEDYVEIEIKAIVTEINLLSENNNILIIQENIKEREINDGWSNY